MIEPGPPRPAQRRPAGLGSWLATLGRLWCLRVVAAAPSRSPTGAIVVLSVLWLAAWVAIDWWQRQPQPKFSTDGIPLLAWHALGVLTLAALLRWRVSPRPAYGSALVIALGAVWLPLIYVGVGGEFLVSPGYGWGAAAVALYVFAYLARGARALTGRRQPAAALLGVVFVAAFIHASDRLDAIPDVWNPREAASAETGTATADEETALFEQAGLIDDALDRIEREPSAGPLGFFLGFAGVGDEKVFAQEIDLASHVLGERYGIADRRLSLVNDERYLRGAPLASVSGLEYALQGLADRMDPERDVLFLAISSHGSRDPAVAVANSGFPFVDLTPGDLADALHDAGIRWRVIIISACYAGGFIEALKDPQTIVITAAAADRTSFGCSNDRDLTYFGEAFYRDALPAATSLRSAFESARQALAERERRERVTPSEPQAYFGAAMEAKLATLQAKHKGVLAAVGTSR